MKPVGSAFQRSALRAQAPEKRRRVSTFSAVLMVGLAVFFDLLQFFLLFLNVVPVVGTAIAFMGDWFLAAFAYIIFYLVWFPLQGVALSKGKPMKLVNVMLSAVIEATPLIDTLPGISYGVLSTVILSRIEDAVYNKENAMRARKASEELRQRNAQAARDEAAIIANRAADKAQAEQEAEGREAEQLNERDSELV